MSKSPINPPEARRGVRERGPEARHSPGENGLTACHSPSEDGLTARRSLGEGGFDDPKHHLRIYHGDCLEILAQLPESSVDLVFADPPYFLSNGGITCHAGKMVKDMLDSSNQRKVFFYDNSAGDQGGWRNNPREPGKRGTGGNSKSEQNCCSQSSGSHCKKRKKSNQEVRVHKARSDVSLCAIFDVGHS